MKNEFFKFSSRRILFSTVMASALLAGSPQTVFAEVNGVQTVMQTGTVKGQVVDATGEPVIGATVQVKGTTNGTITDFDGNFTLNNVPEKGILVISEGGNLAASKIRNLECPSYEICLIDYGCGKFNRKIHIMEQYP